MHVCIRFEDRGFMTLSTLFTTFALDKTKEVKAMKIFFIIHGLFAITTLVFPLLPLGTSSIEHAIFGSIALLVWCALFIPLAALTSKYFWWKKVKN